MCGTLYLSVPKINTLSTNWWSPFINHRQFKYLPLSNSRDNLSGSSLDAEISMKHRAYAIFSLEVVALSIYKGLPIKLATLLLTF